MSMCEVSKIISPNFTDWLSWPSGLQFKLYEWECNIFFNFSMFSAHFVSIPARFYVNLHYLPAGVKYRFIDRFAQKSWMADHLQPISINLSPRSQKLVQTVTRYRWQKICQSRTESATTKLSLPRHQLPSHSSACRLPAELRKRFALSSEASKNYS